MNKRNFQFPAIIVLLFMFSTQTRAQNDCNCCSEEYKQFDFWIGEWIVKDTLGTVLGENTITKLEKDCMITEYWRGNKGRTGRSTNYYNTSDSTWNQLWVDNSGGVLELKGSFQNGKMILQSTAQKNKKGELYYDQITWSLSTDKSFVTQDWKRLNKQKQEIASIFLGIYRKK